MNRQERRKRDREIEKDKDFIKRLPVSETKRMNEIIEKVSKDKARQAIEAVYRGFISALVEKDWEFEEIREIQRLMAELMLDEKEKIKILEKENIDMNKLQIEVRGYMKELISQGKGKKEVIEETVFKFPKATKNMINRTFGEIEDDKELQDAAAYILEDNKEVKKVIEKEEVKKEAKKIAAEVARNLEKQIEGAKEMADSLEILEEVVIKEVRLKGNNGIYKAKTGLGVELQNEGYKIAFSNVEELETFCSEFKKVFERI